MEEVTIRNPPVADLWPNGADPAGVQIEDVVAALVTRLEILQRTPFKCRESALAAKATPTTMNWNVTTQIVFVMLLMNVSSILRYLLRKRNKSVRGMHCT